ncbi:hypothetical protein GALMADRAFT_238879 [Galerina marginata CBS 339.88]|uniref:Uncharacterized protein n=1 Tax=Galerina marginata (strain CBS 339.88) TaxID=685588 RepID=A0A067TIV6_GALM3|nr:hypothetical protein GALMADRAFT_238879 [Galerina marginata CBS 339.88]
MYLGTAALGSLSSRTTAGIAEVLLERESVLEWFQSVFKCIWALIFRALGTIVTWTRVGPSLEGMFEAICDAYKFVETHPHPFHILGWSIFFGPIIILIPCLLLLEILILVLFQLSSVFHGLFPAKSPVDRFDALKDYFMDWRESLFAAVEHWTAVFNKWTVDYPPLLVFRLLAGIMSTLILFSLWSETPMS